MNRKDIKTAIIAIIALALVFRIPQLKTIVIGS